MLFQVFFLCSFSSIFALSIPMRRRRPFCNLSALFLSCFTIESFTRRRLLLQLFYVLIAHARCFLMATKGDLSQLSMTPLALVTGLLQCSRSCLMLSFLNALHGATDLFRLLVGGWFWQVLFSNFLYPIYQISFQVDLVSVLICLTIAVFGTAFAFFLSMKAVSPVSRWLYRWWSAWTALFSFIKCSFSGIGHGWFLALAMVLIIVPMIFLSVEEAKQAR